MLWSGLPASSSRLNPEVELKDLLCLPHYKGISFTNCATWEVPVEEWVGWTEVENLAGRGLGGAGEWRVIQSVGWLDHAAGLGMSIRNPADCRRGRAVESPKVWNRGER